jgi:hypothetical protein
MRALPKTPLLLTATFAVTSIVTAFAWPKVDAAARAFPITQGDAASLEAGLASINIEEIRTDLTYIASDELAGRDTPSEGQAIAARFIEKRLSDLGFEAGAPNGYLYEYPLAWRQVDAESSTVSFSKGEAQAALNFGEDYYFDRTSELANHTILGDVVSIGAGSSKDFEATDVQGKWVLCYQTGSSMRRVVKRAQAAEALGLIITPDAEYSGKPYKKAYTNTTRRLGRGSVGWWRGFASKGPPFPKFYLSETGREKLASVAGEGPFETGTAPGFSVRETRRMTHPRAYRAFENVCGLWRGSDPALANEVIIISAHYDHVGTQGEEIYNGADDNGSGTCGLLALAKALKEYGPLRRSVLLVWVSGEEKGLWGSKAWTERPWLPDGMFPVADINIDMIGRNAPDEILITPTEKIAHEYNGLVRLAEANAESEGFTKLKSADAYWARSDHMNFARNLKLPVTFLFADVHEDYHQPTDTADKIDYDKLHRVVRLVLRMIDGMQETELVLHERGIPTLAEFQNTVRRGQAKNEMEAFMLASDAFHRNNGGHWPDSLELLVTKDANGEAYAGGSANDPWGNPYVFEVAAAGVAIQCLGADGKPGGEEMDADF